MAIREDTPFLVEMFQDGEGFHCYAGDKLIRHMVAWLIPDIPETRT